MGIFFTREITIPYTQITNVHIDRPFTYKLYGVAKLDIVTAADRNEDGYDTKHSRKNKTFLMPVIDLVIARRLARQLLEAAADAREGRYASEDEDEDIDDEESDEEDEDLDDTEGEEV